MIEELKNVFFSINNKILYSSNNPFYNGDSTVNLPTVVLVVFGILFILLGIAFFLQYPKQKTKIQKYKNEQLEEFRKNHPKKKHFPYEATGLYIPSWEKMKSSIPLILGLVFIIIGVFFILGKTLSIF